MTLCLRGGRSRHNAAGRHKQWYAAVPNLIRSSSGGTTNPQPTCAKLAARRLQRWRGKAIQLHGLRLCLSCLPRLLLLSRCRLLIISQLHAFLLLLLLSQLLLLLGWLPGLQLRRPLKLVQVQREAGQAVVCAAMLRQLRGACMWHGQEGHAA